MVQREKLERADSAAAWATHYRWYADEEVARFLAAGGADAALARIRRVSPEAADGFDPPKPEQRIVAILPSVADAPVDSLDRALRPLLRPEGKDKALDYALLIPAPFAEESSVRLWSNGTPSPRFVVGL